MPRNLSSAATKQTYRDRLKYSDRDLETGLHDEIMLWLDANIPKVIESFFEDWNVATIKTLLLDATAATNEYLASGRIEYAAQSNQCLAERLRNWTGLGTPPEKPDRIVTIEDKEWESPIRDKSGIPFGFVDMRVNFTVKRLGVSGLLYQQGKPFVDSGVRYTPTGKMVFVGENGLSWEIYDEADQWYFEVKSVIRLGELIRQVRFYQEALRPSRHEPLPHFVVVAPDDKHAKVLREQGVDFAKYSPEGPLQGSLFG